MSPLRLAILALAALSATDAARVAPSLHRLRGGATVTTVKAPGETYQALASAGVAKATMPMNKALHSAFMGGWYVAIGGVFALVVAGALDLPAPIKKLVIGLIFPIGLVFILQAAGQLMTGNFAVVTAAFLEGEVDLMGVGRSFGLTCLGNAVGCGTIALAIKAAGLLKGGTAELAAGLKLGAAKAAGSTNAAAPGSAPRTLGGLGVLSAISQTLPNLTASTKPTQTGGSDAHAHDHEHEGQSGAFAGFIFVWVVALVLAATLFALRTTLRELELGRRLGAIKARVLGLPRSGPKPDGLKAF